MAPAIASTGQSRSRLPPKWMQQATLKSAAPITRPTDRAASLQESPIRWSTHTLAADPNDTVRSRAESTTSTYVDAFAHRRKSRFSDLTFVDHLEDPGSTRLTPSESLTSSINDLSLTLNNDGDDRPYPVDLPHQKPPQVLQHDRNQDPITDGLDSDQDNSGDDQDMNDDIASRIDRLMAATMEALENSNRLVLDTLSSRAKLAQLNAMEAALDSHLDAREAHLHRQIQAVTDMTAFVSKTTVELQRLTAPTIRLPSGGASTSQLTTLADPAELEVRSAAAAGIVQALDRNATIGKTAVKRLERMLQTPTTPTSSPSSAASSQRRSTDSTRRVFSISNFASAQDSIAEEGQAERDDTSSTPNADSSQDQSNRVATPTATPTATPKSAANVSSDSHTFTPQKKRSISYDSRASGGMKLMTKLAGPSVASTSGFAPSQSVSTAASIVAGPASLSIVDDDVLALPAKTAVSDTKGSSKTTTIRPSLLAALRQDTASTSIRSSLLSNATARPTQIQSISGLPSYSAGMGLKATAGVGATPTTAESTLAALLGMPSAAASTSPRTETPSDSSYFDRAMQESFSSTSPPTPGSIHVIHGVLATPWKPTDSPDIPSSQERFSRRGSMQYSSLVSPRASLSLSDRERANQLSSQLAELRAERVTWNPNSVGSAEAGVAGASTSASGAGGGGALRALQKLNEMSAAKIARHKGTSGEEESSAWYGGSKRVSLGLGLPSFSAFRPSASRSTSTAAVSSAPSPARPTPSTSNEADQDSEAADVSSSSLLGGGWRSWASWNAGTPNGDNSRKQK
ncbi:uncharacterized protein UHOD_07279 [Ustilago sp. UG-2017b]|nr:uncharacterized protein UHOD_07279 [Ustilago sp. UG-2017b]